MRKSDLLYDYYPRFSRLRFNQPKTDGLISKADSDDVLGFINYFTSSYDVESAEILIKDHPRALVYEHKLERMIQCPEAPDNATKEQLEEWITANWHRF